mgnify:CR=1 FL=1
MYEILLTKTSHRFYDDADPVLVRKLHHCFDVLRDSPHRHPNIKRLTGPLAGYLRYRMGDWRVVYEVQEREKRVVVVLIAHRSEAYG